MPRQFSNLTRKSGTRELLPSTHWISWGSKWSATRNCTLGKWISNKNQEKLLVALQEAQTLQPVNSEDRKYFRKIKSNQELFDWVISILPLNLSDTSMKEDMLLIFGKDTLQEMPRFINNKSSFWHSAVARVRLDEGL